MNGITLIPKRKRIPVDTSEYSFAKYAATFFASNSSHQFSKRQLRAGLLDHKLPSDHIAAQVCLNHIFNKNLSF